MKREFLQELGIEVEAIDKIMAENGKDVESQKRKTEAAAAQSTELTARLESLTNDLEAFKDVNVNELKEKITTLTTDLSTKEAQYKEHISKISRQRETESFLNGLKQKFINDETKEYYLNKLESHLDSESSKGKNRQEILDSLIKNENGEVKPNIFGTSEVNKLLIPPSGAVASPLDKSSFKLMGYKERLELNQTNPELYKQLKE